MRNSLFKSRASFFLFCLFPILPGLQAQSALAMVFMLWQIFTAVKNPVKGLRNNWWLPVFMALPTLLLALSLLYSEDLHRGLKHLERNLLLVLFPFILYFNRSKIDLQLQAQLLRFFALVMTLFAWYVLGSMLLTGKFFEVLVLPKAYNFIREYMAIKASMHPTYFSILLAIPIFSLQQDLKEKGRNLFYRLGLYFMLVSLLLAMLLAASKMIMTATLIGSGIMWLQSLGLKKGLKRIGLAIAFSAVLILSVNPLQQRAKELITAFTEKGIEKDNPDSMRKAIYLSTTELIGEYPWFGVGVGDAQAFLNAKYAEKGFNLALEEGYNTHNNYLHYWLSAGFIPFLFFLGLQLIQLAIALLCKNPVHAAISITFSMSMLSENILSRQLGVFTYAFFTVFLIYASWSKSRKQIFINGRFLSQSLTGVQRFAQEVSSYLMKKHPEVNILSPRLKKKPNLDLIELPLLSGLPWEQASLPLYLKLIGSPKLLNLGNSAPICYARNYLCLHDVAFMEEPSWFSKQFVRWYRFMIPRVLKKAKMVFTVSEFSKKEIMRYFGLPSSKITVTYNGIPEFTAVDKDEPPLEAQPYALVVGSLSPRKNQQFIIESFLRLGSDFPLKLLIAGSVNDEVFQSSKSLIKQMEQAPNISWYPQPSDQELSSLYQHAHCTIYMSQYEGFGLPVLESLLYQRPTIVSDIPVFRELFQGLVLFSPLADQEHLNTLLKRLAKEPSIKPASNLALAKLEERFSYQKAATLIFDQLSS